MNDNLLADPQIKKRWDAIVEPDWEENQRVFSRFYAGNGANRNVLNCAVPLARARQLTDFQMPAGWSLDKCLVTSGLGRFVPGLEDWRHTPHIRPEAQLPQMVELPKEHADLTRSPWFQSPSQSAGMALNARHLRYHYQLWNDLKPRALRGLHTTLVLVSPQLGYSLTPHIQLQRALWFFSALSRASGPVQLFPAKYLYPDACLGELANVPAPIFADLLPCTGGVGYPAVDCTPDPWGVLTQFDQTDRNYGYPFSHAVDSEKDATLLNLEPGAMLLPNGRRVVARSSESYVYATLDPRLREELMCNRDAFERRRGLARATITHDGLPFQLPVEMQCMVFAVILTQWEMHLGKPGDLEHYSLRTRHAAIRGFNYYQRVEPFYSQFLRMIQELSRNADCKTYPLATHLTHGWLGDNLRVSNRASRPEHEIGGDLMRHYYRQQLDWMAGVFNLWNHVSFRQGRDHENSLSQAGLAFHQMRRMLRVESNYFQRPTERVSPWPDLHPGWTELNQTGQANILPRL